MSELLSALLMLCGGAFLLIAAVGLLRMPDLMTRMHASTKAGTLGAGLIVLAVATFYLDLSITARAFAALLFIFLTAPVAAHVIGRAAYFIGVPLWDKTIIDELEGRYDTKTHMLESYPLHPSPRMGRKVRRNRR